MVGELLKFFWNLSTQFNHRVRQLLTPILLALFFYLIWTPFALIIRLFVKDPLPLKPDEECPDYWIVREDPPVEQSMRYQF